MPVLFAFLFSVLIFAPAAHAGSVQDNVNKALQLSAAGKGPESALAMREAAADLWQKTPLSFTAAVFVDQPGNSYGMFQPRASNIFKSGEKVRVYAEPVGYAWQKIGDLYQTHLTADAALLSAGGKVLWSKKGFGVFKLASRKRFMEYMMNLNLTITGLPAGSYIMQYSISDKIGGNDAKIKLPFSVK